MDFSSPDALAKSVDDLIIAERKIYQDAHQLAYDSPGLSEARKKWAKQGDQLSIHTQPMLPGSEPHKYTKRFETIESVLDGQGLGLNGRLKSTSKSTDATEIAKGMHAYTDAADRIIDNAKPNRQFSFINSKGNTDYAYWIGKEGEPGLVLVTDTNGFYGSIIPLSYKDTVKKFKK